jgi:hypothetical protein
MLFHSLLWSLDIRGRDAVANEREHWIRAFAQRAFFKFFKLVMFRQSDRVLSSQFCHGSSKMWKDLDAE